uniref:NADH dehydrogenase subunit 6 n=1 Tax=Pediculus schaeffi TaxID=240286 RepID=M4W6T3_PEDSC|nr:NADH dehydrogenase subunit 6 [Pediculus schaeffi]
MPLNKLVFVLAVFFTLLILISANLLLKLFSLTLAVVFIGFLMMSNSYTSWSWLLFWLGILGGLIVSLSLTFIIIPKTDSLKDWSMNFSMFNLLFILSLLILFLWNSSQKEWMLTYSSMSMMESINSLTLNSKAWSAVVILTIYILILPIMEVLTSSYSRTSASYWGSVKH